MSYIYCYHQLYNHEYILDISLKFLIVYILADTLMYAYVIREYGSTPYVGMTRFFSFSPYIGIGAKSQNRPKIDKTRLCIAKYTIYIL